MKTKLLKKVRRKFRIVRDGNGFEFIQERDIFGWSKYSGGFEICFIEKLYTYKSNYELLLAIFDYRYSNYKLKNRIEEFNKKKLTKIWYK
jgi:hypothetical protein